MAAHREWTEEETQLARDLHMKGKSARQIGDQLGRSRNSVIGRLNRLAISRKRLDGQHDHNQPIKVSHKPRVKPKLGFAGTRTLMTIGAKECRYTTDIGKDMKLCGKPVDGDRPYCAECCSVVYIKPKVRYDESWLNRNRIQS